MMRPKDLLLAVVAGLALALCLTACDPSDVLDDLLDENKEQTNDGGSDKDAVTVTADGALVSRGDFSINYPKGTFGRDTRIVVTDVKQGAICGDDEVSRFCKVVMPVSAAKKMTVRIKSEAKGDDIMLIAYMPCRSMHDDGPTYSETCLDVTYSDGEYKATLPAFENGTLADNIDISLGLAHRAQFSSKADMGRSRQTRGIEGESEGNISWYYDTTRKFEADNMTALTNVLDKMNSAFKEAVKQIHDLGFSVRTKRHIPIQFKKMGECGLFKQSPICDEWSHIELNENLVTSGKIDYDELKRTIIHEMFHYFQADYDARWYFNKYRDCKGDELLMYESGGNWIEKFMNNGKPPKASYGNSNLTNFLKGLLNLKEIYADKDGKYNEGPARQSHGYGMGALLEYLTKEGGNDKMLDFYEYWVKHSKPTVENLKHLAGKCDMGIFDGAYDVSVLSCCTGDVIPGMTMTDLWAGMERFDVSAGSFTTSSTCYPYGANITKLHIFAKTDTPLHDKNLVVRQEAANIHTYVAKPTSGDNFYLYEAPIYKGDSIVIKGSDLEQLRKSDQNLTTDIFLISATSSDSKTETSTVTVTMTDTDGPTVSPSQLLFPAEGGTQSVKIEAAGYKRFGYSLTAEQKTWISAKAIKGGTVEFTVLPNSTGQKRTEVVNCYVTNEQEPTEAQKRLLPVTITQEKAEAFITKMEDIYLKGTFKVEETYIYNTGTASSKITEKLRYSFVVNNHYDCTYTKSGTTLHFNANLQLPGDQYYPGSIDYTISFDITGFSEADNYKNCKVANLKGTYRNNNSNATEQIELTNIPFVEKWSGQSDFFLFTFKGTTGGGVKVNNYNYVEKGSYTTTRTYINDSANEFELQVSFYWPGLRK